MVRIFRRRFLTLGAVTGAGVLTGCNDAMFPSKQDTASANTESHGLSYATSSWSSPYEQEVHSGWVHIVADGDSFDLTYDVRLCEIGGEEVEPTLARTDPDEYTLALTLKPESSGEIDTEVSVSESECSYGTRITGGANVPNDWERLEVVIIGKHIRTIKREGTLPKIRPLPDPISV